MAVDSKGNVKKRNEITYLAENLDNTAPVQNIIEYIQSKNKKNKVFAYYCQTMRQRRTTHGHYYKNLHFVLPGHPLYAFSNEWDGGLNSGYFERLSYKSLLPNIITKMRNVDSTDPLTAQMKTKMDWQEKITDYKRKIGQTSRKRKYEWLKDDLLHCPKVYVDLAAHFEQNPDPYFEASYNWYYAGQGNMHIVAIGGYDYLLHSEFSCLYILPLSKSHLNVNFDEAITFECGEGRNIFETIYSSQNIVALRTMNRVYILKILTDGRIEIENLKEIESKMPFTGISFDDFHKNILYVVTLDNILTIVNLDRMSGRTIHLKGKSHLVDNWSTVLGSERGYYTHVARNAITLYDKRTNNRIERWKKVRDLTDDISCNDISVAKHCEGSPYLYFGTDHHLFLMDMRRMNINNNKIKAVQRWTHGMQCLPTYLKICEFEYGKELLCLSSQWCEDMCVLSNYNDRLIRDTDVRGVCMPYRPPSLLSTLSEAQEKMLCCDIYDPIDSRLCTAVTGLSMIEQGDNYTILMQNSLGDISSHVLYPEHITFMSDDSVQQLHDWSKDYKKKKKTFEVSSIANFSKIWNKLKKIPKDYKLCEGRSANYSNFSESEIYDAFKNDELEAGLLDIWVKEHNDTKIEKSEELNLFYSEEEEE